MLYMTCVHMHAGSSVGRFHKSYKILKGARDPYKLRLTDLECIFVPFFFMPSFKLAHKS